MSVFALVTLQSLARGAADVSGVIHLDEASNVPASVIGVELEGVGHSIYGGGLYSQLIFDESFEDPKDVPPEGRTTPSPTVNSIVSMQSVGVPGTTLRHCDAQLYVTPPGIAPLEDYQYHIVPGLDGASGSVSFQSVDYPTYYIAPIDGAGPSAPVGGSGRLGVVDSRKYMAQPEKFTQLASFKRVPGLSNTSLSSFVAWDGRFISAAQNLSGVCSHADPPISAGVWLETASSLLASRATWFDVAVGPSPPQGPSKHWKYTGVAQISEFEPFNGKVSLNLTCPEVGPSDAPCATASNMNMYRRGIAVRANSEYEGYLFLRNHRDTATSVAVSIAHAAPCTSECTLDKVTLNLEAGVNWTMFNITLTPTQSDSNAAFVVELPNYGSSVGLDMVFLEAGAWGRWNGMHLRHDVVERLLLNGGLKSIRFDGTSVVANPNYLWEHARGPAWLRPPRYGDVWYRYISNGFGLFDVLQLAELANLTFVTVGINVRSESPESMANFVEYCFANTSTAYGRLREIDGHPAPYDARSIVIELGNEEAGDDYAARAVPIAQQMKDRLILVAPAASEQLTWALAFNDWTKNWPLAADMVAAVGSMGKSDQLTWDQHDLGELGGLNAFDSHDKLAEWVRSLGWTSATPMYIGETNCAASRELCVGMPRALTYGRFTNAAARKGYVGSVSPAVWAYSTCDSEGTICGASDGKTDWPQASVIITPNDTVAQPSWYAHVMVAQNWGEVSLGVSANVSTCPQDGDSGVVDVVVLRNRTSPRIAVHITSSCSEEVAVELTLDGRATCKNGTFVGTVLHSNATSTVNSVQDPFHVVPRALSFSLQSGTLNILIPAMSLAVIPVCSPDVVV